MDTFPFHYAVANGVREASDHIHPCTVCRNTAWYIWSRTQWAVVICEFVASSSTNTAAACSPSKSRWRWVSATLIQIHTRCILGRVCITHLNLDVGRVYMNNICFTHVPVSQLFFSVLMCSTVLLFFFGSALDVEPIYRSSHTILYRIAVNYTELFSKNFSQFQ